MGEENKTVQVKLSRTTFKVPAENLDNLRGHVESLNRRVARLVKRGYAVEPIKLTFGELYVEQKKRQVRDEVVVVEERVYATVELLSPKPPKVDGWEFVAALTHVEDAGTVLRVCPGAEVSEGELKRYREASADNCDHCHAIRKRTDTFVVRDVSGELRQVGRQCLAAYTGLANPEALCASAEILFAVSEALGESEDEDRMAGPRVYASIASYLPFVACSIREDGWLSRGEAKEKHGSPQQSTASLAADRGLFASQTEKDRYVPEDRDYNLAAATIEHCETYFAERDVGSLTDYENSLRVAMASGVLRPQLQGIVASSINFYRRDLEKRAKSEAWAERSAKSRYQGVVGERGVFENLKVLACRTWGNDFGTTYFYSFCDESDNCYAYFASRDLELAEGQVVSLRARVKKHERREMKGGHAYEQTALTRCSLVARAKVVSSEVVEKDLGKRVVRNPEAVKMGEAFAEYDYVLEKVNVYHMVGDDGRKFVFTSKAKKKALVAGVAVLVEYGVEDRREGDERIVGLV